MSAVLADAPTTTRTVPLSEVVEFNPKPDRGSLAENLEVSFVPMAAVEAGSGRMEPTQVRPYSEVKKGFTYFCDGDVLFAKITPCMENGKMAVAHGLRNAIGFGSTEFHVLRPRAGVDARYVYHFVSSASFRREAAHHMTGAVGQKRVPLSFLQQSELPLPPIDEQRRIVAEIEKQLSRLDEAVANLQRAKANLERFTAAVLAAAVDGSLLNADTERDREGVSAYWQPIGIAIDSLDQGWSPQCESAAAEIEEEWAVMKTTAIQPMRFLSYENKRLPPELAPRPHLELVSGDLLITRAGPRSRVGVSCLVKATRPRMMLCDKAYRLRAKRGVAEPAYLEVALNAPTIVDALDALKTGISDSGLNLTQKRFSDLLVPLPPLSEQHRIVAEVDRRLSIVRGVEAEVDANLKRAQALQQAVLAKAFQSP